MRARLAVLAVLAVAGLIAMLGVTAITVSGAGHEAEVRITAQRLADGRTEFALQQREADRGWSERLLPRGRFFPAAATVGRWLSSTPLTVRGPGGGDDDEGTEVRITAQRLADGRTEFALQQREADGGWSERLLPRGRFSPATATVGRWLSSTPLTVRGPGGGDDAAGAEVRITAQRLADGRTELALLQREADGEWAERLLPPERFVPAMAAIGRWLSSTPLTVSLPEVSPGTSDSGSVASDRAALVALYNATRGATWLTSTNWLSGRPLDQWHSVITNSDGRVAELWLWGNNLRGPIPAELGALTKLQALDLRSNRLTGLIPVELGALTNLRRLYLRSNQLTGPIPAGLGELGNLVSLDLRSNRLTGPIPDWLGDVTNLESLRLEFNRLSGQIPAELGDLTNLESLSLSNNRLTGPIPAELGDLTNLEGLGLWGNQLTGPIPAELGGLSNLGRLVLNGNQLTGPIPAELGELTNLVLLWLSGNELTGCVPAGFRDVARNDVAQLDLPDCG